MARGTVLVQRDRCKGCALCIHACPQHVLVLSDTFNTKGYHPVRLDEASASCTGCGICAVVCPDVVFTVLREPARMKKAA